MKIRVLSVTKIKKQLIKPQKIKLVSHGLCHPIEMYTYFFKMKGENKYEK